MCCTTWCTPCNLYSQQRYVFCPNCCPYCWSTVVTPNQVVPLALYTHTHIYRTVHVLSFASLRVFHNLRCVHAKHYSSYLFYFFLSYIPDWNPQNILFCWTKAHLVQCSHIFIFTSFFVSNLFTASQLASVPPAAHSTLQITLSKIYKIHLFLKKRLLIIFCTTLLQKYRIYQLISAVKRPFLYILGTLGAYLPLSTPSTTTPYLGTLPANSRCTKQFLSCLHIL